MSIYDYFMLDNYYDKHHNHCLQLYSTVRLQYKMNNHMVSGESIIDFTLLLTATI